MNEIDFEKGDGLVPAIVQDAVTGRVLMLGYMDREALEITQKTGRVTFFSRSRQRIWTKGEESGNTLQLASLSVDCDRDTLLVRAHPSGPVCHTGTDTCWGEANKASLGFLPELEAVIADRKREAETAAESKSYVASLFRQGINKIAQKVGEEAVETIIEAKDADDGLFLNECADLLFHYLVLLQARGYALEDVMAILGSRHRRPR